MLSWWKYIWGLPTFESLVFQKYNLEFPSLNKYLELLKKQAKSAQLEKMQG